MSTYPLRGVLYFLGDQHLWRLSVCPVLLTLAVACGVVITLFTFTLRPQEEALYDAGLSPFFAWLLAIVLVIIEVFIVTLIYGLICLEWFKDKIFAHVLSERGYSELVENEERHSPLLRVLTSCCRVSVMLRLGLLVITLPLNMIPVLGNITYAWLNGTLMAWEAHLYYFEMKAFDFEQQKEIISQRKLQYSAFGMQAMLLEMIPIVGAIFMFTNSAGAALFAASIEKDLQKQERRKNSNWRWSGKKGSDKSQTKDLDTDKVPLVNKLGAYVPPTAALHVVTGNNDLNLLTGKRSDAISTEALPNLPTQLATMVVYAFSGILYFLRHPALLKEVAFPLVLTLAFSAVAVFVLISHTLSRQRDWLDNKDVPEACASVLALCIIVTEIFVTTIIYGFVCLDYYQDKIFAFVLRDRGLGAMLGDYEHRSTAARVCTTYFLSRSVLGFISLPLHCLPILGSVVYAWLHGSVLAWEYHLFYFELKGIGYQQQHRWVGRHKLQYLNFGVKYFLGHPALWKQAALPLLLTLAFSFISVFVLFAWTLRPQENWMYEKGLPSVLAWIFAVIAVLVEIFLLSIVYAFVVLEFFKDKIFAFVLRDKELGFMVDAVEQHSSAVRVCTTYCRVDGLFRIALLIISLPLNLIPVVGTLLFAWLHGSILAWEYHLFYFELKGLTFKQQQRWIRQRKWQYSSFGMQALLLQMIPLVGPLFIFSNTCGAALLAVKMERNGGDKWQDIDDDEAPLVHNKGVYGTV
ncbi:hypothetical protein BBJ29_004474 [Phytophthora kernoviae]|uniref:Uncharacterized protein n=1 Tax=Phytophthora kernoviae TaxID=325452 RepID=A0A3F2RLM7_9STRA|nr:hypothetical protein BBP00_00006949 [Phytophthora kernoviae]RLN70429.1 hypothetical protein BBJ29_004474 [Phytophthora kernoviae]